MHTSTVVSVIFFLQSPTSKYMIRRTGMVLCAAFFFFLYFSYRAGRCGLEGLTILRCGVCVTFALNRSFYPSTSSTPSVRADASRDTRSVVTKA